MIWSDHMIDIKNSINWKNYFKNRLCSFILALGGMVQVPFPRNILSYQALDCRSFLVPAFWLL